MGKMGEELGLPLPVTLMLSLGAGVTVSLTAGKYVFKDSAGNVVLEAGADEVDGIRTQIKQGVEAGSDALKGRRGAIESSSDVGNNAKKLDTNNIPNMTKQDIIDSIPDDWNYTEHNSFVHIRDGDGNIRIRIDPPDKTTNYPHVHVYDNNGNLLDSAGNIVDRKSPDGHIPYKGN